jgi:hypothetical protein
MERYKNVINIKVPKDWGEDYISNFIQSAYRNSIVTFTKYKNAPILKAIYEIDSLFHLATKIQYGQDERLLPNFIGRCHSAYLGSVQLSTGGQVVEAYMLLRSCVENALYALYIDNDPTYDTEEPERAITWLNRGKDKDSTAKCRQIFQYGKVRDNLIEQDETLGQEAESLYKRTIDYGAHPNFYGHITTSSATKTGVTIRYLTPGTPEFKLCVQTAVEVGICSLNIFNIIFQDRFRSIGITERVQKINWRGR